MRRNADKSSVWSAAVEESAIGEVSEGGGGRKAAAVPVALHSFVWILGEI